MSCRLRWWIVFVGGVGSVVQARGEGRGGGEQKKRKSVGSVVVKTNTPCCYGCCFLFPKKFYPSVWRLLQGLLEGTIARTRNSVDFTMNFFPPQFGSTRGGNNTSQDGFRLEIYAELLEMHRDFPVRSRQRSEACKRGGCTRSGVGRPCTPPTVHEAAGVPRGREWCDRSPGR